MHFKVQWGILIVGAGPAGLSLANFLDSNIHDVTLIEKSKSFSTMGYGVFLFNEGKKLLRKATHDSTIHKFLRQISFKRYVANDGSVLGDTHYNNLFHVNSSDSITSIKREDFHKLLREHLPENVCLKMGTTICHIENNSEKANVQLSDGTYEYYDVVVGCDGLHSCLRELFFSYKSKKLPWIARYFWLEKPISRFLIEWSRDATVMCMPHKDMTTVLAIEHQSLFNINQNVVPKSLFAFYSSLGFSEEEMQEIYTLSFVTSMQYIYTKEWCKNRVVLIGDAQHAMTPTLGFGTSTALEDAYHLAQTLNSLKVNMDFNSAMRTFAKRRSKRIFVLRSINRMSDMLSFRRSKLYFRFWYLERKFAVRISQLIDYIIRLGWHYS